MDRYSQIIGMWHSYNIKTVSDLEKRLDKFFILFAFHSNKIENQETSYCDTKSIFETGQVSNFSGNPKVLFEQKNEQVCYEFLKPKIMAKEPLTFPLIQEMHQILTAGTYDIKKFINKNERPGALKKYKYEVDSKEIGLPPQAVSGEINELLEEINHYSGDSIITAATYFHAKFEYIHPFAEGNGRLGRTLLNYYLMINNHPPLIIYAEDKNLYYSGFHAYDQYEDIEPLYKFFIYSTIKSWNKYLN
ncbi:MAG: Fic family protein [Syntrophomonadaceae bacterium]|nr:Fic family protein [Syntrophomonadaceae bacterium]